ncbi:Alpha/Beta hydrolase protein [Echria macrotheca]|uniref:Carboxylic ester hydrolase n=1 Tax=Echria macrotheca TaxID=438768 RepID=A0AAJ0BSQ8_9PEZI|nr:Alpha/Beta hydrolase protein [Echria macrotheca]
MSPPVHHHPKKPGTSRRPTVTLRQGRYNGTVIAASTAFAKALDAFRGIPYAQSTAAHNRFRPPQPLPPSDRVFDALEFGKTCPRDGYLRADMSEDCLNLNVYRPAGTTAKKLPVIVYVHGGAFNTGCGIERNMAAFVSWAADPMVAVNFNYRVGPLGFLPSDLTAKEDLLNLGLRDQQLLFQWVQENIAAFGGDPDNVTIMGLSAGAHSVGHHLMYYADHPPAPFAKAILESGATTARAVFLPTHPRHLIQFREFLAAANVNVPEEEVFDRLRQTPLIDIVKASRIVWDKYADSVTWPFQPVIDAPHGLANSSQPRLNSSDAAAIIPDLPITSWRSGRNLRIPVLTGYNTNEGTIFIPHAADTNAEFRHFFQNLIPSLSEADLDALERLYPDPVTDPSSPYRTVPDGKGRQFARLDAAYSHYAYICPVLQTAHFLSTDEQNKNPVYVYRYAARGAFGTANHGDEAPVVAHDMGLLGGKGMEGLRAVADAMHGAWAKFVVSKSGDLKEANWPVYKSPFPQEQADEKWKGTVKRGETPGGDRGQKMVFGEGNDERTVLAVPHLKWKGMKEKGVNVKVNKGVPAQVEGLTDVEMAACRFWWGRVELSEGLGTGKGLVKPRAKL